ncbi:MAG: helix-turn-helix domain-containing protein [Melioribacteraceae bacterium]
MEKNKEARELVEKFGVFIEKVANFQPVSARVVGYLLISEPPYKTFNEILDYLKVSKSSISQALNLLISQDFVDYITLPNDRKRYFRLNVDSWFNILKKKMGMASHLKLIFQEILKHRSDKYPEFNRNIETMIVFFEIFEKEIPLIFKKLEKK